MKIVMVTDAWEPQVNGVVRTLKMTREELIALRHEVEVVSPQGWTSLPCPTCPDIRLALAGWAARAVACERGWPAPVRKRRACGVPTRACAGSGSCRTRTWRCSAAAPT
ncbi:MAG: hypothetical protein RL456_944 [Pseudomonadota bacterium]